MKLHYSKILLFVLTLNILLTSYHAYNKNKPYIAPHHTPIYTSRVLSECDTEMSIYDKDEEMKSVKEKFERQTSQRFEEYEERMKVKRQKRKEQGDKNIQKIIHKDKMEKNLAEKIEKGCLRCGCGLGGVAGSIGLFGGIAINMWKPGALKIAIDKAIAAGATKIAEAAKAMGDAAWAAKVIAGLEEMGVSTVEGQALGSYITATSYKNASVITENVYNQYVQTCNGYSLGRVGFPFFDTNRDSRFCQLVLNKTFVVSEKGKGISDVEVMKTAVQTMMSEAEGVAKAAEAAKSAELTAAIKARQAGVINTIFMSKQTAIIASVVAILIIVLIMVIIYLILRYRRKKKMKKKTQYTKLLNE
ncbi:rifin PIR protein,putative [Plasmodium sp. DRC-Itaito]|nr:rifin PIR protein,putative [Plasmodium sp. DRC-Itaito]